MRVHGGPAVGENWSVGIRDPRNDGARPAETAATGASAVGHVAVLSFSRGGLATSGALRRWWLQGGKRRHHLLNPQTGLPIELWIDDDDAAAPNSGAEQLIATATALAPTAARAEVAAKVALLRGYPRALREVEAAWDRPIRLGQGDPVDADTAVALVLSFGTGTVEVSGNLEAYLATWGTRGVRLPTSAYISPEGRRPG